METSEITRPTADAESYEAHKALRTGPKPAATPVSPAGEVPSPQPSEVAAPAAPATAAPEAAQPQDKGKRKHDAESRIAELSAARAAAERERDDLRKQLEEARKPSPAAATPPPPPAVHPPPPVAKAEPVAEEKEPDDTDPKYADKPYREYLRDHARWVARQEWNAREAATREQTESQTIQQRVNEARQKLPDFDTVLPGVNWADPGLRKFLKDWPNAPEMLHYAYTHPEAQQAIRAAGSESQAIFQWGLISQACATPAAAVPPTPKEPETPPQPRLVSRAPAPPRLLGGSDAPPPKSTAEARTFAEHKALRSGSR